MPGRTYKRTVPVRDEAGERVRVAPALISDDEHKQLETALAGLSVGGYKPRMPQTPFLGVLKCGGCGKNIQLHTTKKRLADGTVRATAKMRCLSRVGSPACKGYVFDPEAEVIGPLMNALMAEIGDKPVTRRVYVKGDGSRQRLGEIEESINYHVRQLTPGGVYSQGMLREKGEQALRTLQEEFERLKDFGKAGQDHWEYQEVGTTFRQHWEDQGYEVVRADLVRAGITMDCHPAAMGGHTLNVPQDLKERFAKVVAYGGASQPAHVTRTGE